MEEIRFYRYIRQAVSKMIKEGRRSDAVSAAMEAFDLSESSANEFCDIVYINNGLYWEDCFASLSYIYPTVQYLSSNALFNYTIVMYPEFIYHGIVDYKETTLNSILDLNSIINVGLKFGASIQED